MFVPEAEQVACENSIFQNKKAIEGLYSEQLRSHKGKFVAEVTVIFSECSRTHLVCGPAVGNGGSAPVGTHDLLHLLEAGVRVDAVVKGRLVLLHHTYSAQQEDSFSNSQRQRVRAQTQVATKMSPIVSFSRKSQQTPVSSDRCTPVIVIEHNFIGPDAFIMAAAIA